MVSPERSKDMIFRDDRMIIQFRFDDPAIRFQAQNLSTTSMRIDWPHVSLGIYGSSFSIRNMATFYDSTRALSVGEPIPPFGVIRDVILPRSNTYVEAGRWRVDNLLPTIDGNSRTMQNTIMRQIGSSISLRLPIEFGSETKTYQFSFSVDAVKSITWENYRRPAWLPPEPPVQAVGPTSGDQIAAVVVVGSFLGFIRYVMTMKKNPVVE
jgi:hypothetical protein